MADPRAGEEEAVEAVSLDDVKAHLALVFGGTAEDYREGNTLRSFGVDSLSMMDILGWVNRNTTKRITVDFMYTATPQTLADHIAQFPKVSQVASTKPSIPGGEAGESEAGDASTKLSSPGGETAESEEG